MIGDHKDNGFQGFGGNDELRGNDGNDRLTGGAGADRLDGGDGIDGASYGQSDAGVTVNLMDGTGKGGHAEGDVIINVEGLQGSEHDDVLIGGNNGNQLYGNDGNDELYGNEGRDWLVGGAGADRLEGGPGLDWLSGHGYGPDSDGSIDVFVFGAADGDDTILDFADNEDQIDLSAFNLSGFDDLTITSMPEHGKTIIDLSEHGGGTIDLRDVDIADLDTTDFLF